MGELPKNVFIVKSVRGTRDRSRSSDDDEAYA